MVDFQSSSVDGHVDDDLLILCAMPLNVIVGIVFNIKNPAMNSVVTIPDFAMRYVSRYLGHDAIRIAILGSRCDTYRDTCLSR